MLNIIKRIPENFSIIIGFNLELMTFPKNIAMQLLVSMPSTAPKIKLNL